MLIDALTAESTFSDRFSEAVKALNLVIEHEAQLTKLLGETMDRLEEVIKEASLHSAGLIKCMRNDSVLLVHCHNRILAVAPASGFARDSRLKQPRCLLCAQFLIFTHVKGQPESQMVNSFRVYPDGHFSNGEESGSLKTDTFKHYISELLIKHLLQKDLLWSTSEDLPAESKKVPVIDDDIDARDLAHSCIGFECSLSPST